MCTRSVTTIAVWPEARAKQNVLCPDGIGGVGGHLRKLLAAPVLARVLADAADNARDLRGTPSATPN